MTMPDRKELQRVRKKLAKVAPTHVLPAGSSKADQLKNELCKKFVMYLRETGLSQKELAQRLGIEPARLNEIVKYRIDLYTVDRLMNYLELLHPGLTVTVA